MVNYFVSSRSIGINSYTVDLSNLIKNSIDTNIIRAYGRDVLTNMSGKELGEFLISRLCGLSGILHIQHDGLIFTGGGDDWDEYETMECFISKALEQFDKVFITYHGYRGDKPDRSEYNIYGKIQYKLLDRYWYNKVLPLVNKCTNLVHSRQHVLELNTYGVTNVEQIPVATNNSISFPEFEPLTTPVKLIVPGRKKDYNEDRFVVSMLNSIDCDYKLTMPMAYKHHLADRRIIFDHYEIDRYHDRVTGRAPIMNSGYIDELATHDIAIISYIHHPPHSGCLNDCISNGLYTVVNSKQYKHNSCMKLTEDSREGGQFISRLVKDVNLQKLLHNNMRVYRDTHDKYVISTYNKLYSKHVEKQQTGSNNIYIRSKTIDYTTSRVPVARREIPGILEFVYDNYHDVDVPDIEYYFTHVNKELTDRWVGVMHGPTTIQHEHITCGCKSFEWLLKNTNLASSLKTCKKIYVLTKIHKDFLAMYTQVPVHVIDLEQLNYKGVRFEKSVRPRAVPGFYGTDFEDVERHDHILDYQTYVHDDPKMMAEYLPEFGYVEQLEDSMFSTHKMVLNQQMDVVDDMMLRCLQKQTPFIINRSPMTEQLVSSGLICDHNLY